MEWLKMTEWSPYAVGIGIGLLSCVTFFLSDKSIGCSTAFSRTSGMLETFFAGTRWRRRPITRNSALSSIGNGCSSRDFHWSLYFANTVFLDDLLRKRIAERPEMKWVVMDLSGVNDIDAVAIDNLENMMGNYRQREIHFAFTGMKGPVRDLWIGSLSIF